MKKSICLIIAIILAFSSVIPCVSAETLPTGLKSCSDCEGLNNVGAHNYEWYSADTVKTYLVPLSDGGFSEVYYSGNSVTAAYYNSDFSFKGAYTVPQELPVFGGFYSDGNNYYILSGQNNAKESDEVEVFRITKYSTSWKRLGSASLYGANTYIPFCAGSARMTKCGKYLIIRTCHEMYTSYDGYNHQANVTIEVDTDKMTVTESFYDVMNVYYGYVSHSFNQFIKVENNSLVGVDHGDAYPRSICLVKYSDDCTDGTFLSGNISWNSMMDFEGSIGANYTGAELGGFEISDSSYLVTGISEPQDGSDNSQKNVFLSALGKNDETPVIRWFTDYGADDSADVGNPFLTKINGNLFLLSWTVGEKLCYVFVNGSGKKTTGIYETTGELSDCEPVYKDGNIYWVVNKSANTVFYSVSVSDRRLTKKSITVRSHKYGEAVVTKAPTCLNSGSQYYVCSYCGAKKTETLEKLDTHTFDKNTAVYKNSTVTFTCSTCKKKITEDCPDSFTVYGKLSTDSGSYWTCFTRTLNENTTLDFLLYPYNIAYKVTSYDTSIATVKNATTDSPSVSAKKAGQVKIRFALAYNPSVYQDFTLTVTHSYDSGKITKKATCISTGVKTFTCTSCGGTKTTEIAKTAHKPVKVAAKAATYSAVGNKEYYKCSVCNAAFKDSKCTVKTTVAAQTIPKITAPNNIGYLNYLGNVTLSASSFTFNTAVKKPVVTVKNTSGKTLTKGTSYTVKYCCSSGCKTVGTHTVTITGKGNYTGSVKKTFKINKQQLSSSRVTLSATAYTFNNSVKKPTVTVKSSQGTTLTKDTSYTVKYCCSSGCKTVGTHTVTITGKGNYTGTVTKTFKINKQQLSSSRVTLSATAYTFNNSVKKPTVTVKSSQGTTLTKDTSYTVSYCCSAGCKTKGTHNVTIKGTGSNYTGTVTKSFTIK